jgi:hypothetical protein
LSNRACPANTGSGALHLARDNQKVGCVSRKAVNGRSDHYVAGHQPFHQLAKLLGMISVRAANARISPTL